MQWEETENYIRSGHRDPSEFQSDSFRTIDIDAEKGVKAVVGKPKNSDKMEIQSYLFSKDKGWTLEKAKEWFEQHKDQSAIQGAERFRWAEGVFKLVKESAEKGGAKIWRAKVLHVGKTRNDVVFSRDELVKAARSLSMRPLNINHPALGGSNSRWLPYPDNAVVHAEFEDDAIEALLYISDPEVNKMIEAGEINAASVEWRALKEYQIDGLKPEGVVFPALALLTKDTPPGDPLASIIKDEGCISQKKSQEAQQTKIQLEKEVERGYLKLWSRRYINDLPDEAFAVILPGGKKDEEGKTTPRSLRKLPHHTKEVKNPDEDSTVDIPHLRNALARLPQTKIPQKYREQAQKHLEKHAKTLLETHSEQATEDELEDILIDHEERIADLEERVEKIEQKLSEEQRGVALIEPQTEAKDQQKTNSRRPADRILYEKWIREKDT
ncbi:MAG: hypothetical protein QXJ86_05695 [Nitrososphaerales archaeon]